MGPYAEKDISIKKKNNPIENRTGRSKVMHAHAHT